MKYGTLFNYVVPLRNGPRRLPHRSTNADAIATGIPGIERPIWQRDCFEKRTCGDGSIYFGPYSVNVTVSDGTYYNDVIFNWTITNGSTMWPMLTNPGTQVNVAGDNVNLAVTASDADGDALTYSADGLPDGLSINSTTGIIFGAVAEDAVSSTPYAVTVSVAGVGSGETTTQAFSWIVNDSSLAVQGINLTEGEGSDTGTVTVATFTDADQNWGAEQFTATINWGDGTS